MPTAARSAVQRLRQFTLPHCLDMNREADRNLVEILVQQVRLALPDEHFIIVGESVRSADTVSQIIDKIQDIDDEIRALEAKA